MKFLKIFFFWILLIQTLLLANEEQAQNKVDLQSEQIQNEELIKLKKNIFIINENLKSHPFISRYKNYLAYQNIKRELEEIKINVKKYGEWEGVKYKELSYQLNNKIKIKENELSLIEEYKDSPIGNLIKPNKIEGIPIISNPFNIVEAYSFIQILEKNIKNYKKTNDDLNDLVSILLEEMGIYKQILELNPNDPILNEMAIAQKRLNDITMVADIVSTTNEVYSRKIDQLKQETNEKISNEIGRTFKLLVIILILITFSIGIKIGLRKYVQNEDTLYTSNKLINFLLILVIIFILLFSYIANASYLVTVLGFASAGIAIALKDWFMSIFGWFVIMTSGAVRVGDRIRVSRDSYEMIGDVLDISLFKMTVREDITLTTYRKTRRSGRIFFVPNNFIFTDLITNYTYDGLKTVWDGIDIPITFESNHQKAINIATEITMKHSRGFMELTKKKISTLKARYVLKNTNAEPRVFTFIEPYGIIVSAWYYTNAYATLGLRSKISMEILDAFMKEDDINIAYPTQTLRVANSQMNAEALLPGGTANGLFDGPVL
jgi:small-conductance mechanosensitive channel